MSERIKAARDEAERYMRRVMPYDTMADHYSAIAAFMEGAVWADANPQPRTITREECLYIGGSVQSGWPLERILRQIGIEVVDDAD